MVSCSMVNCTNNQRKSNKDTILYKKIKFFRFPKDTALAEIWEKKCAKETPIKNIKNAFICSNHFSQDQYIRNLQHELLNYSPKCCKQLKTNAIPNTNLPDIVEISNEDYMPFEEVVLDTMCSMDVAQDTMCAMDVAQDTKCAVEIAPDTKCAVEIAQHSDKGTMTEASTIEIELLDLKTINKNLKMKCLALEENAQKLMKENLELKKKNEFLLKAYKKYNMVDIEEKNNQILQLHKKCEFLEEEKRNIDKIFTPTQLKKLRNNGKRINWTTDDIANAIAIYSNGPQAYRFLLKQNYPFPAVITLKKWSSKIELDPLLIVDV